MFNYSKCVERMHFVLIYEAYSVLSQYLEKHFAIVIGNTERITEIQNKLQKPKWEGLCILTVITRARKTCEKKLIEKN